MYVTPKEASRYFNVSENALRVWARNGKVKFITTKGGHRRYLLESPIEDLILKLKIIYSRVSSRKQQTDLDRQSEYLQSKYPEHTLITDIGSGINYERTGFKRILEGVFKGTISEVVVAHRDRFTRFGYSLFEWIFQQHNATLLSDSTEIQNNQDELSDDLMAIITVFTARYHGRRKYHKIQQESKILS